jgi:hypothetical protein
MGLVEDAAMAKKLGYRSYGEYIRARGAEVPRKVEDTGYAPRCAVCGAVLPPKRRTVCSDACEKIRSKKRWQQRARGGKYL